MNYEEMSDFEINLKVANIVKDEWINVSRKSGSETCLHIIDSNGAIGHTKQSYIDYCNSPSDAWSIIVENKISIQSQGSNSNLWCAFWHSEPEFNYVSPKPLRAAMICFLKMKDAESKND